jgi:sulfate transport system permease protein
MKARAIHSYRRRGRVLPGFGLSIGVTVLYLGLNVLVPLAFVFIRGTQMSWDEFRAVAFSPRALAAYRLTLGTAFAAALANAVLGLLVAWVLVRYRFPGRRFFDALVDLPFALPTAVAGITLTTLYAKNGPLGRLLDPLGIEVSFTPLGIFVALTFVGLPFVVRTVQPVLQQLPPEVEEAAATLGAGRLRVFWSVVLPALLPAVLTGFAMAFARALGEYGSVVFIAGNMPMKTEIAALLIMTHLEQFDFDGATAISIVMLSAAFLMLLGINAAQGWAASRTRRA